MSLARKIAMLFGTGSTVSSGNLPAAVDSVKSGTMVPFAGATAPAGWLLCFGQAVSRTSYADLFAEIGTTYGVGDGSTTFTLPDMRGRVPGGKDDMGGSTASRLSVTLSGTRSSTANGNITGLSSTAGLSIGMRALGTGIGTNAVISSITSGTTVTLSVNSTSTGSGSIRFAVVDGETLGAVGGSHIHLLLTQQMPAHIHTSSLTVSGAGGSFGSGDNGSASTADTTSTGGGQAHPNVQPTIVVNYLIKT